MPSDEVDEVESLLQVLDAEQHAGDYLLPRGLRLMDDGATMCPHARIVPQVPDADGGVRGRCEACGDDTFVIAEPDEAVAYARVLVQAAHDDLERAMEHWSRLKPLYAGEQTEATSALTEIGLCVGEALHRLRQALIAGE